ncbi:endonuclease VII domain-containing protein [Actinoallomurus iriomotensis]|uniref:endonuclease VII domain-containing protein n=2 Tax=Actinoallomurus TaxID=667113 RepID=UPI00255242E0|nr:endonuclease VII domain-containing protein [Actinoallomurus iriomotensis]
MCPDWGLEKNAAEYGRNKRRADGLAQYCKECFRRRSKASYRKRMAERGKQVRERPEVPEGLRYCPQCDEIRPLSAFGSNRSKKDGLATYCRPCHNRLTVANKVKNHGSERSYLLKYRYGLTEDEVAEIIDGQASVCLICLRARSLHVDHDHATGEVRGLICFSCNGALGQFRDGPAVIREAVDYLERTSTSAGPAARRTARGRGTSHREAHLFRRYGIGEDEIERLVEQQRGRCPVCRVASPTVVDHDHVNGGAVRGILCGNCNSGMGQLDDNPWLLRRAIEYLTGGLSGLRRGPDGRFEVTVVRPRRDGPVIDPGWEIGQVGGHDLAVLHAFARDDSGDPWEFDVDVAGPGPIEPRFAVLDLSDPHDDAPRPVEPPRPAEYAFL